MIKQKTCKACHGLQYRRIWMFPYTNGKLQRAKSDKNKSYSNGRLVNLPCHLCNELGKPEVILTGPEFLEVNHG